MVSALAARRPLKLDVSVPLAASLGFVDGIGTLVRDVAAGAGCAGARTVVFGHLAEGNLHVNVLGLAPDGACEVAEVAEAAETEVADAVLRRVAGLGGSISAEHGVGRAKVDWLALSRSAADLAAMASVKRALDPGGLFAPGVLLPAAVPAGGRS